MYGLHLSLRPWRVQGSLEIWASELRYWPSLGESVYPDCPRAESLPVCRSAPPDWSPISYAPDTFEHVIADTQT
eukprot:scaffold4473_cov421-Prasinococcus_capsulatus_cf.AAC.8